MSTPRFAPLRERLMRRFEVDNETGCWNWTGSLSAAGYGTIGVGRSVEGTTYTHRASYEIHVGSIPEGHELHHACENRRCANPEHLVTITHSEHCRKYGPAVATHCARGHEFTKANTGGQAQGRRYCRTCKRDRDRERRVAA